MNSIFNSLFKLSENEKQYLLELDKKYNDIMLKFKNDYNQYDILNMEEEYEKFINSYKKGQRNYYPVFKLNECHYTQEYLKDAKYLLKEFKSTPNNILTKYYIETLDPIIHKIDYFMNPDNKILERWYLYFQRQKPPRNMFDKAHELIKSNKYINVDNIKRDIDAKEAVEIMSEYIKKQGYGWKVVMSKDMIPRMNVNINGQLRINNTAEFSKTDIEGLKLHEVEGHVARRYYGLKTGLYLFLHGLLWRNDLDEGIAIWNSLNLTDNPKPNILINISVKMLIAYLLDEDFYDIFDYCHNIIPEMPEYDIFKSMSRFKREVKDCSIRGGNGDDKSYLYGYSLVNKMNDQEREDVLKYNVGPGQISMIPYFKIFFKNNDFKPLI